MLLPKGLLNRITKRVQVAKDRRRRRTDPRPRPSPPPEQLTPPLPAQIVQLEMLEHFGGAAILLHLLDVFHHVAPCQVQQDERHDHLDVVVAPEALAGRHSKGRTPCGMSDSISARRAKDGPGIAGPPDS